MVKTVIISRVADGLPLAASMDDEESEDLTEYKNQAKSIFKKLAKAGTEQRCSIETGQYFFHYLIECGICYLCLCEKSYPKKLAFSFLEELQVEFQSKYGTEVGTVARPYAFVKFDTFIQKTKKQYKDTRAQRNINKLNEDLQDVTRIMTKNIQDVLGRGEHLNSMSELSSKLSSESKKYLKDAKKLNWMAIYQKYGPLIAVFLFIIIILYIRFKWF